MPALYVIYALETSGAERSLAIQLQSPEGTSTPTHELLDDLHQAVDVWSQRHPEMFVRSDLSVEPGLAKQHGLAAYLYGHGAVNGARLGRHLDMLLENGTIHTFRLRPGGLVEGQDLVGRHETLAQLRQRLESGSVHLLAPRRYGKTSILRQLKKDLGQAGRPCVYIDASAGLDASWLLVTLVQEAMENPLCRASLARLPELASWPDLAAGPKQRNLAGLELRKSMHNVRNVGQRLMAALGAVRAVLLIDEFSVFLRATLERKREQADLISEILASSRRATEPTGQVLAGSAGLSSFLHFHDLAESFADLESVPLKPLGKQDAGVLAEELLYGCHLTPSPEVIEQILAEVGAPIPFFLHVLIDAIREKSEESGRLDVETVRAAYRQGLLGSRGNTYFREYTLAHQPYPKSLLEAAGKLLRELAREPAGCSLTRLREVFLKSSTDETRFEPLLSCLQEDYDLVEDDGRWCMRSKVLRDRWSLEEPWLVGGEP